jgi:hypothetical protein
LICVYRVKYAAELRLTDSEIEDIVAFLKTLTDTKFPQVK